MNTPPEITLVDIPETDSIEKFLYFMAGKMSGKYPAIFACRVFAQRLLDDRYDFRLTVALPGGEIGVNRSHVAEIGIVEAFEALSLAIDEYIGNSGISQMQGVVTMLSDEGFGFIETRDGEEFYFSRDNVMAPGFDRLSIGDEALFVPDPDEEDLRARRVSAGRH